MEGTAQMNFIEQHQAIFALGAYFLFSAIVGGMPDPTATSSTGYQWAFKTLHLLAGNITAAFQSRVTAFQASGGTITRTQVDETTVKPTEVKP
jgi:hypothetical protein